jgi:hypothetical protein
VFRFVYNGRLTQHTTQGTGVQVVEIPPANNQFVSGMLAVASDIVKPAKVPGFMTYPTSLGYSKGDEPARPSERVILYVPGGCVA